MGMYTGLLAAQPMEQLTGLRPRGEDLDYLRPLGTMAHFWGAGLLLKHYSPKALRRLEARLENEAQALLKSYEKKLPETPLWVRKILRSADDSLTFAVAAGNLWNLDFRFPGKIDPPSSPAFALAMASQIFGPPHRGRRLNPLQAQWSFMEGKTYDGKKSLEQKDLPKILEERATPRTLASAKDIWIKYPGINQLLAQTRIRDPHQLEGGLARLAHAINHSLFGKIRGSYVDWITRVAFEHCLDHPDPQVFDTLLSHLHDGIKLSSYEGELSSWLPPARLQKLSLLAKFSFRNNPMAHEISSLTLTRSAKRNLLRWIITQNESSPNFPFSIDAPSFMETLKKAIKTPQFKHLVEINLESIGDSPLAFLRMRRLHQLLTFEFNLGLEVKLRELADPHRRILGVWDRFEAPLLSG